MELLEEGVEQSYCIGLSRRNQGELFGKQGKKAEQFELWKKSIETNNNIRIPTKEDEVEMDE